MNLSVGAVCACCIVCGVSEKLLRCTKCKVTYYCSKEHQVQDWKRHKRVCGEKVNTHAQVARSSDHLRHAITSQGSSEAEILRSDVVTLDSPYCHKEEMPIAGETVAPSGRSLLKHFPVVSLEGEVDVDGGCKPVPFLHNRNTLCSVESLGQGQGTTEEICRNVIRDMDTYGLCVLDNFLGPDRGNSVLQEVLNMYTSGIFKDGQLVSNTERQDLKTIRGDKILWVDGKESYCTYIGQLVSQIDNIVMRANKMSNNGKLGEYNINGRTKAMVACYPGSGSHYVKHVDNPNKDGRCITAIYYLNKDWNVDTCGGLLRVFPEGWKDQVANIEPLFDRVLFFWSDRRNPHEVQPAFQTRYAITLWYFDAQEREQATQRFHRGNAVRSMQKK